MRQFNDKIDFPATRLDLVAKVWIGKPYRNSDYIYLSERKNWRGRIKRKAGIYERYSHYGDRVTEAPENCTLEEKGVFWKPRVFINFTHGISQSVIYCNFLEEAQTLAESIVDISPNLFLDRKGLLI